MEGKANGHMAKDRARGEGSERAGAARLYLVILVSGDSDEVGLGEHVGAERAVGQLEDVVGPNYVEPGLVLVHGVQDGLGGRESTARSCRQPCGPHRATSQKNPFSPENNQKIYNKFSLRKQCREMPKRAISSSFVYAIA